MDRRTGVADRERERHGQTDFRGDVEHGAQGTLIVTRHQIRHELQQATSCVVDAAGDRSISSYCAS